MYKTPFQRVVYRSYEGTGTSSTLELYPHSQILLDIYQSISKFPATFNVECEVSILHVYHKSVQQSIVYSGGGVNYTTVSPNLLGLEGSKRGGAGDPDNSPLTGGGAGQHHHHRTGPAASIIINTQISLIFLYVLSRISLWHICNWILGGCKTTLHLNIHTKKHAHSHKHIHTHTYIQSHE